MHLSSIFCYPPSMVHRSDDSLTAAVDMRHCYVLLATSPFLCKCFDLQRIDPHEFTGQIADNIESFDAVSLVLIPGDQLPSAADQFKQGDVGNCHVSGKYSLNFIPGLHTGNDGQGCVECGFIRFSRCMPEIL